MSQDSNNGRPLSNLEPSAIPEIHGNPDNNKNQASDRAKDQEEEQSSSYVEFQEEAIYLSGIEGILSSSSSQQEVFVNFEGSTCKQNLTLLQDDSMLLTRTPILQASPLPTNPSNLTHLAQLNQLNQLNQLRNGNSFNELK